MSARDKFIALTAGFWREHTDTWMCTGEHIEIFADLIRADERDTFIAFIQDYPHWLGDNAKREIISAIRARGNT